MATCGEVLVKILENYGVDTVFGIPGVHTVELYRGLPDTHIKHITPRHEQGAGFMADGYARVSGKPGVCLIITGPGMTNIATAMGQALADSIPMLVISSVNRTYELGMGEGRLHEMPNQRNVMSGVSVFSHTLLRADELPKVLARAFTVFNSERPGPVHIEIPIDVITSSADHIDQSMFELPEPPAPAPRSVARAVALLAKAQRPLIALGGGAANAGPEIIALAEKLGAPVVNTVNAKGIVPYSHPLAVGGSGSWEAIRKEFTEADVVLAVGTEFGETDYDFFFLGDITIGGALIRVDIDASQLTRNVKAQVAILSDAKLAVEAINNELLDVVADKEAGVARATALKEEVFSVRNEQYAAFFDTVRDALPEVVIAGDSTQPTYYAWVSYETEHARRYFHSASGFGTLGYGIPAAIGAKLARPDLPVVALIGDGAAQFTIGELASAVEAEVPVIFLIWNNNGYGEIKRFMEDGDIEQIGVNIYTPDFIGIGKAFGCETRQVNSHAELHEELIAANQRNKPTLIELPQAQFADGYA
ncbi:5-guanidino-2-oxopentanoate decarboxylase [Dasania marina]|uniref:5-guanidino-2-oxopentanoate decarboxylase n=1 Tax=Dasania marina TaxID=471499 RepID=UPI0030DBF743|tara:strand:- start:16577 stop:18178 length:1602 start_codon:yes stop_codon:yes gene_type:complete